MTASLVPAVEDAIYDLAGTALPNVSRLFGPLIAQQLGSDVFMVGSPESEVTSSSGTRTVAGFGGVVEQRLDILCSLHSSSGGDNTKARRDRVAEMFDAIDAAIRADQTLGGLVGLATITSEDWTRVANEQGVACDLSFTVTCLAMP